MEKVTATISRSIKEGKWLSISYKNSDKTTYFWIAIISIIDIQNKKFGVKIYNFNKDRRFIEDGIIYFEKIIHAQILEGTSYDVPKQLIFDIEKNIKNLSWLEYDQNYYNILSYLRECVKYDKEPYQKQFALINGIDNQALSKSGKYSLSLTQIDEMIKQIKKQSKKFSELGSIRFYELVLNILSIKTYKGLFVIAYKKVYYDPETESLILNKEINYNSEFLIEGEKHSLYTYLDNDVLDFQQNYQSNKKEYHNRICERLRRNETIDEWPYLIELVRDINIDYQKEFYSIMEAEKKRELTVPLKAFFGTNSIFHKGKKDYDIMLIDDKVNIDQLRVIHNALKNPVTYVQGPPGTGKTQTILNVIVSAFFNNMTVLICSNNNKPIDTIYNKIKNLKYQGKLIPFPIIRLGNNELVLNSLKQIKTLYEEFKEQPIFYDYLNKQKENKKNEYQALNDLLNNYEEKLACEMRIDALSAIYKRVKDSLKSIIISDEINKLKSKLQEIGEIKDQDALNLLRQNDINLYKWLYYTSIDHLKKLKEPKYKPLLDILNIDDDLKKVSEFNKYLKDDDNLSKFIRIFPFIVTTNISAARLGNPEAYFHLTIMDEAGQCSVTNALIPIIRGKNLLLVGDQNQLNPVLLLDQNINKKLMEKYQISPEYNYIDNSILRLMQSVDNVSKFILLRYHYRSHKKIIDFSDKKYYQSKLIIETNDRLNDDALTLLSIKSEQYPVIRNTSEYEIEAIIKTIKTYNIEDYGIITPFRNQADLIKKKFKDNNIVINDDDVGTVHTFQGDEKDVIFLTTAITSKTPDKTFEWVKNNRELLNVASTRAKNRLIVTGDYDEIKRRSKKPNDLLDLFKYVESNGKNDLKINIDKLYEKQVKGYRNYNSEAENDFLQTISHYLTTNNRYYVKDKVKVSTIFDKDNVKDFMYFLTSEFDFVIFEKGSDKPVVAFELDGLEHQLDPAVIKRDSKKEQICKDKGLILKRFPNNYARRYELIKDSIKNILK